MTSYFLRARAHRTYLANVPRASWSVVWGGLLVVTACETVDPGPNFVLANESFDADFFFCRVEPEYINAKKCGSGDTGAGDRQGGCHFNSGSVSGMALVQHPAIDCGGGDRPLNRARLGAGSPAQANYQSVSLEMSRDPLTAPIVIRPQGANHPRAVVAKDDPALEVLKRWAAR